MDLIVLQNFLGWCTVINYGVLIFSALLIIVLRKPITKIHSKMMSIDEQELPRLYFSYLANYKMGIFLFNLVPYVALFFLS